MIDLGSWIKICILFVMAHESVASSLEKGVKAFFRFSVGIGILGGVGFELAEHCCGFGERVSDVLRLPEYSPVEGMAEVFSEQVESR